MFSYIYEYINTRSRFCEDGVSSLKNEKDVKGSLEGHGLALLNLNTEKGVQS